ncbi:MAG: ATP-binding protein [Polyangiales bacterium]
MNTDAEVEARWSTWLLERNRRGARVVFFLVAFFYPFFAVLDYVAAPREALPTLYVSRVIVTAYTLVMFGVLRSRLFNRQAIAITATYMVFIAAGIGVMILLMGGYRSPYYAGLNLIMVAAGLLFVWPARVALAVHTAIVMMFVVPSAFAAKTDDIVPALTSFFFLGTTATTAIAAQIFGYRSAREQVVKQILLEEATEKLSRAHEELQRLDRFKSRFFANITHELKTPLAMVLSPIELLIAGELGHLSEPQRATLRSVHRNGARLLKLIGDLLDLSRLEESRLRLAVGEHDLVAYLRQLVAQVEPLTGRKNISVSFETACASAPTWCDLDRMERVFVNLLSNAAKFTPVGGHITVSVRATPELVTACVGDNGPGFPEEMADQVFERFFQVDGDASHNRYNKGGTGIGLALARELVELHGGRIWAESAVNKGARFFVELPRDRGHFRADVIERAADAPADARPREGLAKPDLTADFANREEFRLMDVAQATERRIVERDADERARGRTILVVEDTPDVVKLIHLILRQQFRIFTAPDGKRGLELALREAPHLIITDLMMPEMDGYELTRALRANEKTKHIPIVMLTARGEIDDRVRGLESGVNSYLTKPFAARELLATVRKLLEVQDSTTDLVLTRQMDSLEIVAGGLAHEINNPLNYIKNSLQRVHKDVDEIMRMVSERALDDAKLKQLDARTKVMFKTAESGVARIADTVSLMGRYSREGYSRVARAHDLFAAVRDVVSMVLPATGRRVEVTTKFEGDGTIECVPEELHQLLTNLIQNAIEASPDGTGRVEVTGSSDPDVVTLSVRDNGPGVKPEDHGRIFTPFFTTKAPGAGMGMGLTISWRVVQSLGGMLSEEGTYGEGALFVARIPRHAAGARAIASKVPPPPRPSSPAAAPPSA